MTTRGRSALARHIPWTLIVFLVAFWVPWLGSRYDTFLATQIAISSLFAVSLNLLLGTTGLVSFGHVAYFGVGAYVCGILVRDAGIEPGTNRGWIQEPNLVTIRRYARSVLTS